MKMLFEQPSAETYIYPGQEPSEAWKQRMLQDYDKITKNIAKTLASIDVVNLEINDDIRVDISKDYVDHIIKSIPDDNPETLAEKLFPLLVKRNILPNKVDRIFISCMENNDSALFYLVVLTLERYEKFRTRERVGTYIEVCYDEEKNKYANILRSVFHNPCRDCRRLPMFCRCHCNHCFLFMKKCDCTDDEPKMIMGEEL